MISTSSLVSTCNVFQLYRTTVARWHSFQRNSVKPNSLRGQSLNSLTVGQILVLRKLAMLKLTAIMERYCPTHRTTGWNWELPKFIRKAKMPDYKGNLLSVLKYLCHKKRGDNYRKQINLIIFFK